MKPSDKTVTSQQTMSIGQKLNDADESLQVLCETEIFSSYFTGKHNLSIVNIQQRLSSTPLLDYYLTVKLYLGTGKVLVTLNHGTFSAADRIWKFYWTASAGCSAQWGSVCPEPGAFLLCTHFRVMTSFHPTFHYNITIPNKSVSFSC